MNNKPRLFGGKSGGEKEQRPAGIFGATCETCDFWIDNAPGDVSAAPEMRVGTCRVSPPNVVPIMTQGLRGNQPAAMPLFCPTPSDYCCAKHPIVALGIERMKGQAWREGEQNALYYDRKRRDMNRVPTPEELEALARAIMKAGQPPSGGS